MPFIGFLLSRSRVTMCARSFSCLARMLAVVILAVRSLHADGYARPSLFFEYSPARTSIIAGVAHAECSIFFANKFAYVKKYL